MERTKSGIPVFKNVKEVMYNSLRLYKNNIAFTIKHKKDKKVEYENITYKNLLDEVNNFGASLYSLKVRPGSRVAIMGRNRYEWIVAHLTNLMGGMVSVPLDKDLQVGELEDSLIRSKATVIVFDDKYLEVMKEIKKRGKTSLEKYICMDGTRPTEETEETKQLKKDVDAISMRSLMKTEHKKEKKEFTSYKVDGKKMSILLFTSGTTSKSKAVMLSQEGIAVNIWDMLEVEGLKSTDTNIAFLPFHHIFGSVGQLVMLSNGIKTVFTDGLRYLKDNFKEYKVSVFVAVPLLIEKLYQGILVGVKKKGKEKVFKIGRKISDTLLKCKIDIRRKVFKDVLAELGGELRLIISGGAPLAKETAENVEALGITLEQGYGLTETSPVVAAENIYNKKNGTIGVPLEHVEVKLVDQDENGVGELCVKGPTVMLGYYEDKEATDAVLEPDGWFHTGDLAMMDKKGFLTITGRKKDVIVLKNGKKVFPDELEFLVKKIPGVEEVFVYGKPNEEDANDLMVCVKVVYLKDAVKEIYGDVDEAKLHELIWEKIKEVNKTLPKYKYIKGLTITDVPLIKTTTNKVKRNEELKLVMEQK